MRCSPPLDKPNKQKYHPFRTLAPADLAYQESIIQEREREIQEIETGIHELNEIFRDLGTLVVEQGGMLGEFHLPFSLPPSKRYYRINNPDNIESNVSSAVQHTDAAATELHQASEYQRSAGRRACCLMIILVIVISIVLLAVRIALFALRCMIYQYACL